MPRSVWTDDAPAALATPPRAPLPARTDVVVAGAGICGAWCASELARRGRDVLLLDARTPGDGATGRNAGFLLSESDCYGLAAAQHGPEIALALRDAGLRTRALVRELVGRRARAVELSWPGSVRLSEDEGETRAFETSAAQGFRGVRSVDPAVVAERGARPRYVAALEDTGDGLVHPLKLLDLVLDTARATGAAVHPDTPVLDVVPARGGVDVTTAGRTLHATHLVLATSAAARRLLPVTRPIRPVRAQALVARVTPAPGWKRAIYATRGGDYWRPLPGGRVLLGGLRRLRRRNENTASERPSHELQRSLAVFLRSLIGRGPTIEVTHRWAGTMAFTPDALPWVGALPGHRHVSVLAGMNGHGMGWAPAFAESLAAHLCDDGPPPPGFARPGRPRIDS